MTSYCGTPPLPEEWLLRWNLDPVLLLALAIATAFALRSARPHVALGGIAALVLAFVSPLCALAVSLFAVRAVHHTLLVAIAAPLFALAWPGRRALPLVPTLIAATATLWAWHLPALYDLALQDSGLYWLMQLSLLGTAFLSWRALFAAQPVPAALTAIAAMAQMGMLGALLTFAPRALYAAHATTTQPWDLSPLADQQLAGLIMWVPGIAPYALAVALIARRLWTRTAATA